MALTALGFSSFASAGEDYGPFEDTAVIQEESSPDGFCDALKSIGKLYKNPENPLIQEFTVFGRFQYQGAFVTADDANGDHFHDSFDEIRRFRVGAKAKVLQYFDVLGRINLEDDRRPQGGDLSIDFVSFDELLVGFDIKKAFNIDQLDKLHLGYGRYKFSISQEANTSSKKILTVERSAISNKVFGNFRPTGAKLTAKKGPMDVLLGIYSTEFEDQFVADWTESIAYQARVGYEATDDLYVSADFVYNDGDVNDGTWQYKWATSVNAQYTQDRWGIGVDMIYGDNGDVSDGQNADRQDYFWGVVVIPHYWLVKNRIQAVARYQYQGSEAAEGIRLNSRYVRRTDDTGAAINSGRGDQHHSYYAGVNFHLCGDNAKFMVGAEYDDISTPGGDVEALTWWLAFRTYF